MFVRCLQFEEMSPDRDCVLECGPDKTCYVDTCCARTSHNQPPSTTSATGDTVPNLRQRVVSSTPEQAVPLGTVHDPAAATFADNVSTAPAWSSPAIETADTRA